MNSRVVNISSLIILLSLLCFIAEILTYYLVPSHWISVVLAGILALAVSHFCLESSLGYNYSFLHAAFMVICTFIFGCTIYLIQPNPWIQYDFCLVLLVLVNWLVPLIYNTVRDALDHGPRFCGFSTYFNRMTFLFLGIYLFTVLKQYFITPITPPYPDMAFGAHNFVPFMSLGSNLEILLRQQGDLQSLAAYVAEIVAIGIPFGFFCKIFCGKWMLGLRILLYIAFPAILEAFQALTGLGRYDLDDISLHLIGVLIGILIYHITNTIFYSVANRGFLMSRENLPNYFSSMS